MGKRYFTYARYILCCLFVNSHYNTLCKGSPWADQTCISDRYFTFSFGQLKDYWLVAGVSVFQMINIPTYITPPTCCRHPGRLSKELTAACATNRLPPSASMNRERAALCEQNDACLDAFKPGPQWAEDSRNVPG